LGRLVPACEQDQEAVPSLRVVHAVARTEVDLKFRNSLSEVAMIPRISMDEAINSDLNAGSSRQVLQRVDPLSVDLGFLDYHPRSVAYRIRYVKGKRRYFL
jgi:hypothetical protein